VPVTVADSKSQKKSKKKKAGKANAASKENDQLSNEYVVTYQQLYGTNQDYFEAEVGLKQCELALASSEVPALPLQLTEPSSSSAAKFQAGGAKPSDLEQKSASTAQTSNPITNETSHSSDKTSIFNAIDAFNFDRVKQLVLEEKENLNRFDEHRRTPLVYVQVLLKEANEELTQLNVLTKKPRIKVDSSNIDKARSEVLLTILALTTIGNFLRNQIVAVTEAESLILSDLPHLALLVTARGHHSIGMLKLGEKRIKRQMIILRNGY